MRIVCRHVSRFRIQRDRRVAESGSNMLIVEVQPPEKNDLAITFVDWAPKPPDQNMGLWQDVELRTSGRWRCGIRMC